MLIAITVLVLSSTVQAQPKDCPVPISTYGDVNIRVIDAEHGRPIAEILAIPPECRIGAEYARVREYERAKQAPKPQATQEELSAQICAYEKQGRATVRALEHERRAAIDQTSEDVIDRLKLEAIRLAGLVADARMQLEKRSLKPISCKAPGVRKLVAALEP